MENWNRKRRVGLGRRRVGAARLVELGVLALAAIGVGVGGGAGVGMASEDAPPMVRIRNWTLYPSVIHIDAGEEIGWRNQTSRAARVVFQREAARGMVCHGPSSFRIDGSSLTSPLTRGGEIEAGCTLGPGEYTYRVELRAGQGADGHPLIPRELVGRVIVQ